MSSLIVAQTPFTIEAANTKEPSPFAGLPLELTARIFAFVTDPLDQENLKAVCNLFYSLSKYSFVQKDLALNRFDEAVEFRGAIDSIATLSPFNEAHIVRLYECFKKYAPKVFLNFPYDAQVQNTLFLLEEKCNEVRLISSESLCAAKQQFYSKIIQGKLDERVGKEGAGIFEPLRFFNAVNEIQKDTDLPFNKIAEMLIQSAANSFMSKLCPGNIDAAAQRLYQNLLNGIDGNTGEHFILLVMAVDLEIKKNDPETKTPLGTSILNLMLLEMIFLHFQQTVPPTALEMHGYIQQKLHMIEFALVETLAKDCDPLKGYVENQLVFTHHYDTAVKFLSLLFPQINQFVIKTRLNQLILSVFKTSIEYLVPNIVQRIENTSNNPNSRCIYVLRQMKQEKIQALTDEIARCVKGHLGLRTKLSEAKSSYAIEKFTFQSQRLGARIEMLSDELKTLKATPEPHTVPLDLSKEDQATIAERWTKTINQWNETIQLMLTIWQPPIQNLT